MLVKCHKYNSFSDTMHKQQCLIHTNIWASQTSNDAEQCTCMMQMTTATMKQTLYSYSHHYSNDTWSSLISITQQLIFNYNWSDRQKAMTNDQHFTPAVPNPGERPIPSRKNLRGDSNHIDPASLIHYTILAIYKFICMYVCISMQI